MKTFFKNLSIAVAVILVLLTGAATLFSLTIWLVDGKQDGYVILYFTIPIMYGAVAYLRCHKVSWRHYLKVIWIMIAPW